VATSNSIRVAVHGAAGKVGMEVLRAIAAEPDMELVAAIDRIPQADAPTLPVHVPYYTVLTDAITAGKPDVIVDFTNAEASLPMARVALAEGVRLVVGSTGWTEDQLAYLSALCDEHKSAGIVAPNFALGAVLLTYIAGLVAPYFEYVDVSEEHHEAKIDAPSGTAMGIAKAIHEGRGGDMTRQMPTREPLAGTRGGDYHGISVHSSRMPGRMAHHQVTFGTAGQTLTLRHDTINRECYMPGVLMAVRKVMDMQGLTVGLEKILNFGPAK
jgi:4-hydroxy-tetrahydrodipicolinate reductase